MLRKLLKYEFKSVFYLMLPFYCTMFAVSAVCRLFMNFEFLQEIFGGLPYFFIAMVCFGLFVALGVLSLITVIQRFYKGLLSEEGYLMFTLPVKPWQLIVSKGIVSTVVIIAGGVSAFISIFILTMNLGDIWSMFFNWDGIYFDRMFKEFPSWPLLVLEVILLMFVYLWKHILHTYSAMSFGQLANKNRVVLSIVIYGAEWLLFSLFWLFLAESFGNFHFEIPKSWYDWTNHHAEVTIHLGMWMLIIWQGIEMAVYYLTTHYILSKKLNLE